MSETNKCPRCSECSHSDHHWMANPSFGDYSGDADDPPDVEFICKHCSAIGRECTRCYGDGDEPGDNEAELCSACDGDGVILLSLTRDGYDVEPTA